MATDLDYYIIPGEHETADVDRDFNDNTKRTIRNFENIDKKFSDIPAVNNPTVTIKQGGVIKGSFALNQSSDTTVELDVGGGGGYSLILDYLTLCHAGDVAFIPPIVVDVTDSVPIIREDGSGSYLLNISPISGKVIITKMGA